MRYENRTTALNENFVFEEQFLKRGVKFIEQYTTPRLLYPTAQEIKGMEIKKHTWVLGDRYFKLAYRYYQSPQAWWVIAWFNQAPTESHLTVGQTIHIPTPLNKILNAYGV